MNASEIAKLIDHTLLRADATVNDIEKLCSEALQFGFHSVCVHPFFVPMVRDMLSGSVVRVTTVIGFPLGMTFTRVKVCEAIEALLKGSDELDIVMNIGMAKSGQWSAVKEDISDVISATRGGVRKIIIETCSLNRDERVKAAEMVLDSGAEFIKTSTGFGPGGATREDIRLIKSIVKNECAIKASGGIRTLRQVREFLDAGARRIGTSAGVEIMKELSTR
jgi:deoxyribose-phosphate aldolase